MVFLLVCRYPVPLLSEGLCGSGACQHSFINGWTWSAEEKEKMSALNNPVVAVIVSLIITVGYFVFVDHYLMDMQGLDFWYLFRN